MQTQLCFVCLFGCLFVCLLACLFVCLFWFGCIDLGLFIFFGTIPNLPYEINAIYTYYMQYPLCTSSTAQGGGGSFKNRKPIGEVGCCESGMAERSHWWSERCLRSPLFLSLSLSFSLFLSFSLSISVSVICLAVYLSIYLSLSLFHRSICLAV